MTSFFKRQFFLLSILLSFFCCWQVAYPSDYEIYVFGHAYKGETMIQDGKIYVPPEPIAKAMNLRIETQGDTLLLGSPPTETVSAKIVLNGKPFVNALQTNDGKWLVELLQVFTLKNKKGYVLTYTASEQNFDQYLPSIQSMIDSFEIK